MDKKVRCAWVKDEYDKEYHDNEWGRALHNDRELFELFILEGMQAGLSWNLILKKRQSFREAFDGFDPEKIIAYDSEKIEELMNNGKIVRNRRKIEAAIANAKAYFHVQAVYGSFDQFLWQYVDFKPIVNHWENSEDLPCETELSKQISKDMKKLGFKFAGPTIIYSFMQASGMVDDHMECCYRKKESR